MSDQGSDGTDKLCRAVYGREARPRDYLGGSEAHMLHDAAAEIERLRESNKILASGEYLRGMADAASLLLRDAEAPNYVEVLLAQGEETDPSLIMTLRRLDGKTPHQLRQEAEDEIERLRGLLRECRAFIRLALDDAGLVDADNEGTLLYRIRRAMGEP